MGLGASIVSNHILENKANIKWILRENSVNELDNGLRFLSEIDTEEYLSHAENMSICDWGTIVEIEPAVLSIFNMPIGTELTIIYEDERVYFFRNYLSRMLKFTSFTHPSYNYEFSKAMPVFHNSRLIIA